MQARKDWARGNPQAREPGPEPGAKGPGPQKDGCPSLKRCTSGGVRPGIMPGVAKGKELEGTFKTSKLLGGEIER